MAWVIAASYGVAASLLVWGARLRRDARVARALDLPGRSSGDPMAALGRLAGRTRPGGRLVDRLRREGEETPERALGARIALAMGGALLGASAWPAGLIALPAGLALAAGGFTVPRFLRARRVRAARRGADSDVPDLVDAVALGVSAGLTPRLALDHAAGAELGSLAAGLRRARDEVAFGATWWESIRALADRSGAAPLDRLAIVLERSARLGIPALAPLRGLAVEVRGSERARREERAMRAPVLMLFPLVFCILPAFVVAAVVPAMLVATRGIG